MIPLWPERAFASTEPPPCPTYSDLWRSLWDRRDIDVILARTGGRFTREGLIERLEEDRLRRTTEPAYRTIFALVREVPEDHDWAAQWRRENC